MDEGSAYGKPGDPVPVANVEDIKAVWKLYDDAATRNPGESTMIGMARIQAACKPGADLKAVWFRSVALQTLMQVQKQAAEHQVSLRDLLSSGNEQEAQPIKSADSADWKVEANDAAFRVIASIPMKWQALGR